MNGDVYLYDCVQRRVLAKFRTDCVTSCTWSADSRSLLMGTCFPRIRIDNRLYRYACDGTVTWDPRGSVSLVIRRISTCCSRLRQDRGIPRFSRP